jgi:hypothetical protein
VTVCGGRRQLRRLRLPAATALSGARAGCNCDGGCHAWGEQLMRRLWLGVESRLQVR